MLGLRQSGVYSALKDIAMPKLKPCKGVVKRVKVTATGKVKWKRAGGSHLNSGQTGAEGRALRKKQVAQPADINRLQRQLHQRLRGVKR
jgi:large subunit ribosomal protein L35